MLTRPVAILLPVLASGLLVVSAIWRRQAALPTSIAVLVLLLVNGLTLAPWQAFLAVQAPEHTVLLSSGGAASLRDGLSFNHKTFRQPLDLPQPVARLSDSVWQHYDQFDGSQALASFLGQQLLEDPVAVLATYSYKAARCWYGTDSQNPNMEWLNLALLGICVYFWGMAMLVLSIVRYMVPVIALLLPFTAYGYVWALGLIPAPHAAQASSHRK